MLDKKNILMLCHRTPPFHGVSIMGDFVYDSLPLSMFNINHVNISISNSVHRGRFNIYKNIYLLFKVFYNYFNQLHYFKPSIIYITPTISDNGFYRDFVLIQLTKFYNYLFGRKNSIFLHIHMRPYKANYFQRKYLFKIFFSNVKVILLSDLLLKDFGDNLFVEGQVSYLPNMIFPVTSKDKVLKSLSKYENLFSPIQDNKIYVSYLGHLIESKGYRRALQISKILVAKNKNIVVNFYGEFGSDEEREYFESFIRSNKLQNSVHYAGVFPRDQIWKAFENTHLMIFPSYTEAYPLTILEAISVGIPVVATDTGAVSEIIGNFSGDVVKFSNSESDYIENFVSSILKTLSYWEISMSIKSIYYFNNNWSNNKFTERLIKILNT